MPALAIASSQRNILILERNRVLHLIKQEEAKKKKKVVKKHLIVTPRPTKKVSKI